jgi:hypothetical protein
VPALDFGSQPEARTTAAEIEDRARHVRIPVQILADRIAVGESEDSGDVVCVDQVIEMDTARHDASLHVVADVAYGCERIPSAHWCSFLV